MEKPIEYREIVLPNGDVLHIKFENEGIVYDRFDHKGENHLESYGYDFYSETVIPKHHANITGEDVEKLAIAGYRTLLKALDMIEVTPARSLSTVLSEIKQMVYEECPSLVPEKQEEDEQ